MQTIYLMGLDDSQLEFLSKQGYASFVDELGKKILPITVTNSIGNHMELIGQILFDAHVMKKTEIPQKTE